MYGTAARLRPPPTPRMKAIARTLPIAPRPFSSLCLDLGPGIEPTGRVGEELHPTGQLTPRPGAGSEVAEARGRSGTALRLARRIAKGAAAANRLPIGSRPRRAGR